MGYLTTSDGPTGHSRVLKVMSQFPNLCTIENGHFPENRKVSFMNDGHLLGELFRLTPRTRLAAPRAGSLFFALSCAPPLSPPDDFERKRLTILGD
uniref:Uncharacterized protein n=1 Tax=Angiostrongylus cantonensis TaxID=6313 RepID=A0A0K0DLP1_ANGCA